MRRSLLWLLPMLGSLCLSCGGSGSSAGAGGTGSGSTTASSTTTTSGSTTASSSSGAGGMMAGGIPNPGSGDQVDQDFTDMEPNDTPTKATPLGTALSGNVNVWVTNNTIGGADTADYFVFKSGPTAGTFTFNICFSAPITAMNATLWKVVNATAEMPPLGTWPSSGTCVQSPAMGVPLEASTDYLLGLTATGGAAAYNA